MSRCNHRGSRVFAAAAFSFALTFSCAAQAGAPGRLRLLYNNLGPQQTKEATGLWLERAARGGFNAVTYPIGVFRRDYEPTKRPFPGFDPIASFIGQAHERKMTIITGSFLTCSERTAES